MTKRRLNRTRVIQAARSVLEEQGGAALTIRSVAAVLLVDPMALYRHVEDKLSLERAVADSLLTELTLPYPTLPRRERLFELVDSLVKLARSHPHTFELMYVHLDALPSRAGYYGAFEDVFEDAALALASRDGHSLGLTAAYTAERMALQDTRGRLESQVSPRLEPRYAQFLGGLESLVPGPAARTPNNP